MKITPLLVKKILIYLLISLTIKIIFYNYLKKIKI